MVLFQVKTNLYNLCICEYISVRIKCGRRIGRYQNNDLRELGGGWGCND